MVHIRGGAEELLEEFMTWLFVHHQEASVLLIFEKTGIEGKGLEMSVKEAAKWEQQVDPILEANKSKERISLRDLFVFYIRESEISK
ncbi:hypothetical protein MUG91_G21n57 [Manis pentadactyla]|nr:hypothetical protein MUG91_G21n57 [Manis pentadactyla]